MNGLNFPDLTPMFWFAIAGLVTFVLAIAFLPLALVWLTAAPAWAAVIAGGWAGVVLAAVVILIFALRD